MSSPRIRLRLYTYYYSNDDWKLTVCSDGESIKALWFTKDGPYAENQLPDDALITGGEKLPVFSLVSDWLDTYFDGEVPDPYALPLAPDGSRFRQDVWNVVRSIRYGHYLSYKEVADEVAQIEGKRMMAAQAVGGAVGHNPISILIPCHRVVGAGSWIGGYGGNTQRKINLLRLEGADLSRFDISSV